MNKWIGVGNITREIEMRFTQGGKAVASFSIAINSGFGDNKKVDYINIVAWEKLAELCSTHLGKGRKILVEGRLEISSYEKDGVKRQQTQIVAQNIEFLDKKQDGEPAQGQNMAGGYDVSSFGSDVDPEIGF